MKAKQSWSCIECGNKQSRWTGQCTLCKAWNSFQEEVENVPQSSRALLKSTSAKPKKLSQIEQINVKRIPTGISEIDRALGGGVVPGSLTLIGGDPGIGKSTLSLQIAQQLTSSNREQSGLILYICGEESLEQVAIRARRMNITSEQILFTSETECGQIAKLMEECKPILTIIDSIQVIYRGDIQSSPGTVAQVRECTASLMQVAKTLHTALFLIGHVTKSGDIAGPKILEHLVDTVLYFEGDRHLHLRVLRVMKNRFGPTDEIALFQMSQNGLEEVSNPSQLFLQTRTLGASGSVIIPTIEGSRPMLIEAQALVTDSFYSTPSRRSTGIDPNRLQLLLAVCEKRCQLRLGQSDVFASVTGGMKISEPAADLGLILAIYSSFSNKPFNPNTLVIGEVGLAGEVRAVQRIESRVKEGLQLGFTRCLVPKHNLTGLTRSVGNSIDLRAIEWVDEALEEV